MAIDEPVIYFVIIIHSNLIAICIGVRIHFLLLRKTQSLFTNEEFLISKMISIISVTISGHLLLSAETQKLSSAFASMRSARLETKARN